MLCVLVLLYCHRTFEWNFTHYIAFQFYTLFSRPEWCTAVFCTTVVRPQEGVPWMNPSHLPQTVTLPPQPSLFPLTLPAVELVAITFMNLQQFGFIGEYKYFRFSIPCIFIYVTIRITNSCDYFCTVSLFPFSRLFPTCFGLLWAHHQGYLQLLFLCYHLVHAVLCWSSACISGLVCGGDFSVLTEYTEVTTTNQFADARRRSTKHCMNQMVA